MLSSSYRYSEIITFYTKMKIISNFMEVFSPKICLKWHLFAMMTDVLIVYALNVFWNWF